jgi:hypothetical protein
MLARGRSLRVFLQLIFINLKFSAIQKKPSNVEVICTTFQYFRVADPHHFNAYRYSDPAFHFYVDPDPTFDLNSDPKPVHAPNQSDAIWNHRSTDPPRIHFEPINLLSLHFSADSESGSNFQKLTATNKK